MTLPELRGAAGALEVQRAIDRAAGGRPIPGNRVRLLHDGPEIYPAMLELIAGARRWIHFENYIIRHDATGQRFAEALVERARRGVAVRVLYDWLGSVATRRRYWERLRRAGIEVRCFNPPRVLKVFGNVSRDHRKLVVVDGTRAVTGGHCIGDEWAGDPVRRIPPWRDTGVLLEGPAAQALDRAFASVWSLAGPPLPAVELAADPAPCGDASVRVIMGEPGRERAYRVLEYLAAGCRERLWITDAYLVPPPRLFQVLIETARDGVDVRLLVPGASDVPVVRNMSRIGYRELIRAGIRIFEWDGPMLHAKTMVADGCWTRIGTSNLNASSLLGNWELDVVIEDQGLAQHMEHQFRRDIGASLEVLTRPRRLPAPLARVTPPVLTRQHTGEHRAPHQRGHRERRRRAMVALITLASGARRSLFGPASLALIVLGSLFIGLPRPMAYGFGGICLWFAIAAGLEAWRRRA
ncbi:MAG TPA: phospholipase D-like domain-containing protein [Gemmatimonadales bacterium]|nr:phospholipase D-like domain-containing protein [Gemmatimonadales bacterium]